MNKELEIPEGTIEPVNGSIKKKNVILDSQVLTAVMKCARYTDFRFNHRFVSIYGKGNALECGSIVHKFLEVYRKSKMQGLDRDKSIGFAFAAAELYIQGCKYCTDFVPYHHFDSTDGVEHSCNHLCITKPKCGHPINEYPGVKNTPAEIDKDNPQEKYKIGWKWVLETCQQYVDFYRNDHWTTLAVEEVKSKILYEDDEVRILWKAKFDWIVDTNQGIYPCDTKTMKMNRDTLLLNNQFKGQCILTGTRGIIIDKVGFQTTLKPEQKFLRPIIPYTADLLMEWQSQTLPHWAKMLVMYDEMGFWPANYTGCETKYGKCDFYEICKSDPHMREEELRLAFVIGDEWNPVNEE